MMDYITAVNALGHFARDSPNGTGFVANGEQRRLGNKDGIWLDYEEDGEMVQRRITYKRGSKIKADEYTPFDDP